MNRCVTAIIMTVMAIFFSMPAHAEEVTGGRTATSTRTSPTVWIGFAAAPNGRVFQSDSSRSEDDARNAALTECEDTTQRTCNAIAVTEQADVTVVHCSNGSHEESFLGGSNIDRGAADWLAYKKAAEQGFDRGKCRVAYTY